MRQLSFPERDYSRASRESPREGIKSRWVGRGVYPAGQRAHSVLGDINTVLPASRGVAVRAVAESARDPTAVIGSIPSSYLLEVKRAEGLSVELESLLHCRLLSTRELPGLALPRSPAGARGIELRARS